MMSTQPVIAAVAPAAGPQAYSPPSAPDDPRSRDLAEALASLHDQAKNIRTPTALASDLLAEALLQRRYGQSIQDAAPVARGAFQPGPAPDGAPAYAPQGRPGPLQVAPVPQATPVPSPSPGAPPPSAPAGTASAVPAATSPAAGAATGPAAGGQPRLLTFNPATETTR